MAKEAPPPAETEDETLMTSLEAALVAEEASAAARSTMAQSSVQKLAAAERLRAEADAALARGTRPRRGSPAAPDTSYGES